MKERSRSEGTDRMIDASTIQRHPVDDGGQEDRRRGIYIHYVRDLQNCECTMTSLSLIYLCKSSSTTVWMFERSVWY